MEKENTAEKPLKMEKLTGYGRKLKKLVICGKSTGKSDFVSPACAVCCDELFRSSEGTKGHCRKDFDADPVVAAHIAAQNHFSFRPNIYI